MQQLIKNMSNLQRQMLTLNISLFSQNVKSKYSIFT